MSHRWVFRLVLLAAAVLLLVQTGSVPIMDPDEARYARTSLEMLRSGDLVVPTFEGLPRVVKPPLLHWLHMPLFRLFGTGEWVVRFPSTLSTLMAIWITGWIARRRFGEEGAVWAAVFMTTSFLVMCIGRLNTLDALLAVHVLAVIALDIAEPEEVGRYRSLVVGCLLGLAFLAKGPVGVIVPLLVILAGRTAAGRSVIPSLSGVLRTLAGWCAVALPWGLVFLKRVGSGSTGSLLKDEVLERFFGEPAHMEPPWYYAGVLLVGFMPWVAPLVVGMFRVAFLGRGKKARTGLYAGAGLLAGLLFFSLSSGKLPTYILPLAPLVAILVTWELGQELEAPHERRFASGLLAGTMAAFGALLAVVSALDLPAAAGTTALAGAGVFIAGSIYGFVGVLRHRPRQVYGSAAAASGLFLLLVMTIFLPTLARTRSSLPLLQAVPEVGSGRPLIVVAMKLPSLTWYLDQAPEKRELDQIQERMDRDDAVVLVMDRRDIPSLGPGILRRLHEIGSLEKYVVLEEIEQNPNLMPEPGNAPLP
jgi:4-amino-4-deoxy-L-arabinose transferase-like glycosyltransferase